MTHKWVILECFWYQGVVYEVCRRGSWGVVACFFGNLGSFQGVFHP